MSENINQAKNELSNTESQQTINDRQFVNDPDPYSEKQELDERSSMGDANQRVIDKNVFYQFTHGSHPDLHNSNGNLAASRSDLASVVRVGHAPTMTPNINAINEA